MAASIPAMSVPPSLLIYFNVGRIVQVNLQGITLNNLGRNFMLRSPMAYDDDLKMQYFHKTYPSGLFDSVAPEQILESNPPIYFKQNLEHLTALAKVHGIETLLM